MPSKKLGLAQLPYLSKKLGSAWLALLFQKPTYHKKTKNELISNIFVNFLRYNPEDINKSVCFLQKSCILEKSQQKIVKNCSVWLGFESKKLGSARQKVGLDPTLPLFPLCLIFNPFLHD